MKKDSVFIIAEAGVNHNGRLKLAKRLVDAAKTAGADAVKFQTYRTEDLVTRQAPKAAYQNKTVPGKSQYDMLKGLELSAADFKVLSSYCRKKKILFLSTPFDIRSADLLRSLGMKMFKVSSGDLTNIPMLKHIAKYKRPMILSTGMADIKEIREAVKAVRSAGNNNIVLMQCTSNYPSRHKDINLRVMAALRKTFKLPAGLSDHSTGIEVSIAAAALGASIIEKHFTLDRGMNGPDHMASLEPAKLKEMVLCVRNVENAMGSGNKLPSGTETEIKKVARKSIVALSDIPKGARIKLGMITVKRPGTGIEPKYFNLLIGKTAGSYIEKDTPIKWRQIIR